MTPEGETFVGREIADASFPHAPCAFLFLFLAETALDPSVPLFYCLPGHRGWHLMALSWSYKGWVDRISIRTLLSGLMVKDQYQDSAVRGIIIIHEGGEEEALRSVVPT